MAYSNMTASQLRNTVRQIVDLDTDDLPDGLLDLYVRDGYYRILDVHNRWPWLETSFSFNTVPNTRSYNISGLTVDPLSQVISIVDNTGVGERLTMIGYDEAEGTYVGAYDIAGEPLFYAVWDDQIHLYPKPNNQRTMVCRGYRQPFDWITSDGNVDAHPSLHFPLVYYAVSRVYQQLEDATMSSVYKQSFDEGVALATSNVTKPTSHNPMIMAHGATRGRPTHRGWLQALGRNLGQ
jgi:hypothetical protein